MVLVFAEFTGETQRGEGQGSARPKYAAIHIDKPFGDPFVTIPGGYHALFDFTRTNGLVWADDEAITCFETCVEGMGVYIACK